MTPAEEPLRRARPTSVRYIVLIFLAVLSILTYLDRVCISRVKEKIAGELSLSDRQMGFIFSAFLLGYALFEVPGGRLGDRWGSRRVLTRIVLWWSLFTALTGAVAYFSVDMPIGTVTITVMNSFVLLLLVRFLFGCGEAGAYPNVARVVGCWFPYRERAMAQGVVWFSARWGGFIAPIAIGRLSAVVGWRWAFLVLGCLGAVWAVLFVWWFRDRPEDQPSCNREERDLIRRSPHSFQVVQTSQVHTPLPWDQVFRQPTLWALSVAAFGVSFGWYFFPTWFPQFLKDQHGITYDQSEVLTGLPFLWGAIGCLFGGTISDWLVGRLGRRWGRSSIGVIGFTGAGCCFLAGGLVGDGKLSVWLFCLAACINDFAIPVIWAVNTDVGGRHAGSVSGFVNMIGAIGGLISPIILPYLKDGLPSEWSLTFRWHVIFAVLSTAWLIAAGAWLFIDASKPLFTEEPIGNGASGGEIPRTETPASA